MEFNSATRPPFMEPLSGMQSTDITIKLPDLYGIHVYAEKTDIQSVPYWVTDEHGRLVCSGIMETKGRVNRFFWPGTYTLTVDWGQAPDWNASRWATIGFSAPLLPDLPLWAYLGWSFLAPAMYFIINAILKKRRGI